MLITVILRSGCSNKPGYFSGEGVALVFPETWHKIDAVVEPPFNMKSKFSPFNVVYACPEEDPNTFLPAATIGVYRIKPDRQLWLADDFPDLVNMFAESGFEILDKGEILIDDQISKWVVYRDNERSRIKLEFFVVNDNNVLYRIQYSTSDDKFAQYRPDFEATKSTIKLGKW